MKTISVFLILLIGCNSFAQSFADFLSGLPQSGSKQRNSSIADYLSSHGGVPLVEGKSSVYFVYKGEAGKVAIASDATGWSPSLTMTRIESSDYWYCNAMYEPDARLEYKIVINDDNWILDPLNERVVTGGVAQNSELIMPDYQPPLYTQERDVVPWGTYSDTVIYSKYLKENRPLRIYLPPRYEVTDALYPLIIFQDGFEMFDRMDLRDIMDNMSYEHKMRSLIAVYVQPVHRDREYSGKLQKRYTLFITKELLPFIDAGYRTIRDPERRALAGISNGGNISLWIAATHPGLFGKVAAQSSNVENNVLNAFRNNDLSNLKVYLDFGKYDLPVLVPKVRALKEILEERSIPHLYREVPEGHNWESWQKHIPDALEYLFPD